jgi:hypothetical protein
MGNSLPSFFSPWPFPIREGRFDENNELEIDPSISRGIYADWKTALGGRAFFDC